MRVTTLIKKLFGEHSICDYMDILDSEEKDSIVEYYAIQWEEDAAEPDYFIKLYVDGLYTMRDTSGNTILHTYSVQDLKNKLKVLAAEGNT